MPAKSAVCQICQQEKRMSELLPAEVLRPSLVRLIKARHPDWSPAGYICISDLNRFRMDYVKRADGGALGAQTRVKRGAPSKFATAPRSPLGNPAPRPVRLRLV
jgi:hypothetical protein